MPAWPVGVLFETSRQAQSPSMPWLKPPAFHKDLTSGIFHWFLLSNVLLMFSAFCQRYTYGIATTENKASSASVQFTLQPTPSSKSPARTTTPVNETTTLWKVDAVSSNPQNFKTSVDTILSKQTTGIVQPSLGNISSTDLMGNNESNVIRRHEEGTVDEDISAVFYRKVSSAFEALFLYFLHLQVMF